MSPDPSALAYADPTNPQGLNLYSYALNNPLRMVDPSGLVACFYGGAGDTPQNDQDPSDYAQTDSDAECTAPLDSNGNGGGQVYRANAEVDVNPDGSGAGDVITSVGGSSALVSLWTVPNPGVCTSALSSTARSSGGISRANAAGGTIDSVASANNIPPALLAATGVHETDFRDVQETLRGGGAGPGMGVFQLTNQPGVSAAQAFNVSYSANYAAGMLSYNSSYLAQRYPSMTPTQLLQGAAAGHNKGVNRVKPGHIDSKTATSFHSLHSALRFSSASGCSGTSHPHCRLPAASGRLTAHP